MRTKYLLMTMALPLAFAACTSDEFESQGVDINLAERTEIGQVDLLLNQGEAETRWGGDMLPEVSDVFGAALVDAPRNPKLETEKGKWYNDYEVKDYISTNYPYTFNGNRWTSEAKLVEGNYLFYAPYAEDHQVRSAIKYAAPVVQDLKVENGAVVENSALTDVAENFKSPFYFAYKFFDAADDNRNLSLTMRPIFAYPKFTLKNNTGEAVTITRIVLQSENLDIPASGEFNNNAIVTAMNDSEKGWGRPTADYVRGANDNVNTADLLDATAESYVKTNLIRADLSEPVTIANNGTMTFNLVVPAMEFAQGGLKVYFVNEEDMGYVYENTNSTVRFVPARPNPKEEYNVGTGAALSSAGRLLTKTLAADEPLEAVPYIVTTTAELIDAIDNATPNQNRPLKLTIGGDIEFNADVLGAIAENLSQPVVFVGALDIVGSNDAAKPLNINQKIIFDEATISGNVQFGEDADGNPAVGFGLLDKEEAKNDDKITVEENASLTIDALAESFGKDNTEVKAYNGKIVNNGTLTVKGKVKDIENNGTLNIETGAKIGELSKKDDKVVPVVNINDNFTYEGNEIVGEWAVAADKTITLAEATELPNNSSLTVKGDLKSDEQLTVKGTLNVDGQLDADVVVAGEFAATAADTDKVGKLVLGDNAVVLGDVKGEDYTGEKNILGIQIVEVEEGTTFMGVLTDDNLMVRQTITGNVTESKKINRWANTLEVTGSVIGSTDAAGTELGNPNLDSLIVRNNIQAVNGEVIIITSADGGVKVVEDVLAAGKLTLTNTVNMDVAGLFNTVDNGALVASSLRRLELNEVKLAGENGAANWNLVKADSVIVNGVATIDQKVQFDENTVVVVKGNVNISQSNWLKLTKETLIAGNVTFGGAGEIKAMDTPTNTPVVKVSADCTLTNNVSMTGNETEGLTFESVLPDAAKGEKVRGKVVNNGKITNATWAYNKDAGSEIGGKGWWSGNKAARK